MQVLAEAQTSQFVTQAALPQEEALIKKRPLMQTEHVVAEAQVLQLATEPEQTVHTVALVRKDPSAHAEQVVAEAQVLQLATQG